MTENNEIWRDIEENSVFEFNGKNYEALEVQPWGILAICEGKMVDLDADKLAIGVVVIL
jgi:hypothetical protein